MSNEDHNQQSSVLVHLENAADKMNQAFVDYRNEKIDQEELQQRLQEASPTLVNIGCDVESTRVNTKPVPENAESIVYFYRDDDGTLKMTVRIPRFGDNEELDDDATAPIGEMAGFAVLQLVLLEHQSIIEKAVLSALVAEMQEGNGNPLNPADPDDPLSTIEDEETREQVRKFMKH